MDEAVKAIEAPKLVDEPIEFYDDRKIESLWVNNVADFLRVTLPNVMACLILLVQLVGYLRSVAGDNQIMTMLTGAAIAHLFQQSVRRS
jgi:hypothetical protein